MVDVMVDLKVASMVAMSEYPMDDTMVGQWEQQKVASWVVQWDVVLAASLVLSLVY